MEDEQCDARHTEKRMKIIEIIPQLSSGGAERFAVDLCNALASAGHEVTLVVLHAIGQGGFYADELSPRVRLRSMDKRMGADPALPLRLLRLIRRERPDVVHTHLRGIVYAGLAALLRGGGAAYFHTVHSAADKEAGGFVSRSTRRLLFRLGRVTPVTISPESLRSFREYYGSDAPMIVNGRDVPAGLQASEAVSAEVAACRRTPHTRVLVCLARVEPVKRHAMLARVAARLAAEGHDLAVLCIGSTKNGALVEEIRAAAPPGFHLLGERKNPLEYLQAAGAYALCSSYEGMPISLIEALGVGAIPVCTPVGGIVDTVHDGVNGILARDLSEEAYAEALRRYLTLTDRERDDMSRQARESYAPYSMTACASRYIELFGTREPRHMTRN